MMDDDSCVLKYIEIVPLSNNSAHSSDIPDVEPPTVQIKVEPADASEQRNMTEVINEHRYVSDSDTKYTRQKRVTDSLHLLTKRDQSKAVTSAGDECVQENDERDAALDVVHGKETEDDLRNVLSVQSNALGSVMIVGACGIRNFQRFSGPECKISSDTPFMSNVNNRAACFSKDKRFVCSVCNKAFSDSQMLRVHERTHSGEKPYTCSVCSKAFSQLGNLKAHERIHSGEKPFVCHICDKAFSQSSGLFIHKRIHSDVKLYKCNSCSKTFKCAHYLTQHKRVHSGEKPFICDICNKAFSQSSNLVTHKRTHSDDKLYKCNSCSETFKCAYRLRRHKRIHFVD